MSAANLSRIPPDDPGWPARVLTPSPRVVAAAAVAFVVVQLAYQQAGAAVLPQAPLDWTNHLLTTLLIVWAARRFVRPAMVVPALVASVVIDADHIPGSLGSDVLTAGTHRPYTHSLATVVALLLVAAVSRRRRLGILGACLGVCSHLWRDLAEPRGSGVALLWPLTDRTLTTPAWVYLTSLALLLLTARHQSRTHRPG